MMLVSGVKVIWHNSVDVEVAVVLYKWFPSVI